MHKYDNIITVMKPSLSKSQFLRGLQCHKSLWLYKYRPELRAEPDESLQAIFAAGTEVGILAQGLFPGGERIEYEGSSFGEKIRKTKELIDGGAGTIYEATFNYDNVLVMVDILHRGEDGWEIYEVKRSTEVKDEHVIDVSIQLYVLAGCGLGVSRASLVHVNREYVRRGDIDISDFFIIEEITEDVRGRQGIVREALSGMREMLKGDSPDIEIGPHCSKPYDCDFAGHCWRHIPENSVFDLRDSGIDKFAYYRDGKIQFTDLDLNELNFKQRMQVEAELDGAVTIDDGGIGEFLDTLHYPLCFLDFETLYMLPVPPYDGTSPNEKIPFQYSLHILDEENSELRHYEYLAGGGEDGRERIARELTGLIPDGACVLAYNMGFEKGVIRKLADRYPKYSEKLMEIHDGMKDLMEPFKKRHYYQKEMKGSYSIKKVLPALLPELSYEGMGVSDGGEAMNAYMRLPYVADERDAARIRRDLLEYCKLDTLAMVRLLEKLRKTV